MEFIQYSIIGLIVASLIFLLVSRQGLNAYVSVVAFSIISFNLADYEFFSSAMVALGLILVLLYLDRFSEKREVFLAMIVIFVALTFTHVLMPFLFIIYSLVMFLIERSRKYLNLFIITSAVYASILFIYKANLANYIRASHSSYCLRNWKSFCCNHNGHGGAATKYRWYGSSIF